MVSKVERWKRLDDEMFIRALNDLGPADREDALADVRAFLDEIAQSCEMERRGVRIAPARRRKLTLQLHVEQVRRLKMLKEAWDPLSPLDEETRARMAVEGSRWFLFQVLEINASLA